MEVVKLVEPWGISHEQVYHMEALQMFGERVIMRLRWTLEDLRRGEVDRCRDCQAGVTQAVQDRVASAYEEAGNSYCDSCFGIGFTGGFRPIIYVTWMLNQGPGPGVNWKRDRFGMMRDKTPQSEFPWYPRLSNEDLIVRVDRWVDAAKTIPLVESGRFVTKAIGTVSLHTGPGEPGTHEGEPGLDSTILAQTSELQNLSQEHPFNLVPVKVA